MNSIEEKPQTTPTPAGVSSVDHDDLVVRAVHEYLALVEAGERPDRLAFAARFPEIEQALAECLGGLDFLHAAVPELSDAAGTRSEGTLSADRPPASGMLGEFRIIREVGRGGMGIVYEAEQVSLGRRVALKVLPFAATLDAKQLQRFKNEAQAAAHLQHQNIVPVHSVGCERGVYFYAMQFIEGQTLAAVIDDLRWISGKLDTRDSPEISEIADAFASERLTSRPPKKNPRRSGGSDTVACLTTQYSITSKAFYRTAALLGEQAAQALEHAHQLGVIHRDIKPANLLVDSRGNLWIADFGLAQFQTATPLTLTGDLIGTLRYMSPEQTQAGKLPMDHRTDIYSLGATLYELLTLEPAFPGDNRVELLRQIALEEPRPLRRSTNPIPAELQIIVAKAMEKNPADRYATAQELADDLRRFLEDKSIRARRPTLPQRAVRWARRHKSVVWSAVAVLAITLTMLAGTIGWVVRDRETRQGEADRQRIATEHLVAEDLTEAASFREKEQWSNARQALERAKGRLDGSGLVALQDRVEKQRREAVAVERLEDARLRAAPGLSRLGRLEEERDDPREADRFYSAIFAELGLPVGAADHEETARLIRGSAIRTQLVAALDDWAIVKDGRGLRAIAQLADGDPWLRELRAAVNDRAALDRLAQKVDLLLQPPATLLRLCASLERAPLPSDYSFEKDGDQEERLLRQAQHRHPTHFGINYRLAHNLLRARKEADAIAFARAALATQPQRAGVHYLLGICLWANKALSDAADALKVALDRKPHSTFRFAYACVLIEHRKWPEAEDALRTFIELSRDNVFAYERLGIVLREQGKTLEAIAAFRKVEAAGPYFPEARRNLAEILNAKSKPSGTKTAALSSIDRFRPSYSSDYFVRGMVLKNQKKQSAAEAAFQKAVDLIPDSDNGASVTVMVAGVLLLESENFTGAEAAFRKAIKLQPDLGDNYFSLSQALQAQGRFAESLDYVKQAEKLGMSWTLTQAEKVGIEISLPFLIRRAEQFVLFDGQLPKYLNGELQPSSAAERAALAAFCGLRRHRFTAAAVRFYSEAFAAEQILAEDLESYDRYYAACMAALAGCGRGNDAANLPPEEYVRLRDRARAWLRDDLTARQILLKKEPDKARFVRQTMTRWQEDKNFDGVRGEPALEKLPESERQEWHALWQEVAELERRAAAAQPR